ncbi:hypothetical protein ELI_15055 [Erythrobacter litoralis HTCC2594]|uniref:Uncharacterized protein n=1 Tax=Erythrobacter litoralis (strain HTCC2594) TaxID=314225 RepID=Q2N5D8_ERYLH|nr:hypothetical protein ELI_15055 [Erythrobacter litoralis HTCC2594]
MKARHKLLSNKPVFTVIRITSATSELVYDYI